MANKTLFRLIGICLAFTIIGNASGEQSNNALPPLNRFPRMMQEWIVKLVREAELRGNERRNAVHSPADADRYVQSVQDRIRQVFGPLPEKSPLNARVTRRIERDTYFIENILFESRPGFPVTGNLYLPKAKASPSPGVIGVCGHSTNGKAAEAYQSFSQGLAAKATWYSSSTHRDKASDISI